MVQILVSKGSRTEEEGTKGRVRSMDRGVKPRGEGAALLA